jgi:hypothetical protein
VFVLSVKSTLDLYSILSFVIGIESRYIDIKNIVSKID